MSRKPHTPTDATRQTVQLHATVGTPQETIARVLGVDGKTLRKYYRDELDISKWEANAIICGRLFNKANGGDTIAMMFWLKTRAGWRETNHFDHTSTDGSMTPRGLTAEMTEAIKREILGLPDVVKLAAGGGK